MQHERAAGHWPRPADAGAASRLAERFSAIGPAEARLAASRRGASVLAAIGGNSPYLSDLALREPACLRQVLTDGPDRVVERLIERVRQIPPATARPALAATLRRAKRQIALAIALADMGVIWSVAQVVASLSAFAEAALVAAVDHLLLDAATRKVLTLPERARPSEGSGFIVLGMGKLGARELNYSSDIDLVLIYDPAPHLQADRAEAAMGLAASFSRIAQGLVALLQQRDADGYVFRTDLRLRPDPAATPPVVSLPAALAYYESLGQNWERAAMLKARPVAGDLTAGQAFLEAIRPFVWRRGLDFAAMADIHAMKRRIDAHKGAAQRGQALTGFDVKLGRGGIREIEFLTQTLQLVWGGRDPALRGNTTLGGLLALTRAGHLGRRASRALAEAYLFLRSVEHRLQMVADRQTHRLPESEIGLEAFAVFHGATSLAGFERQLRYHLARVRQHYAATFEAVVAEGDGALDFSGPDTPPATLERLGQMGFAQPGAIAAAVRGWQAGRVRALRSERARELLGELLPRLLEALAKQAQPDSAFTRFDQLLGRLPAGVQLLSLMQRNHALIGRIAAVLGAAPLLADYLARMPQALEGLVDPVRAPTPASLLRQRLQGASTLEDAMSVLRRTVREADFLLTVETLEGQIDVDAGGVRRTRLADAAIASLLPYVLADARRRFGTIRGGGVAIVALGKAGSSEMMAGSDLDLMLVYDHPREVTESRADGGSRVVPVTTYYSRVAQTFIAALTASGADGPLYAVDMRLRPSGNAGPVAVSLPGFRRYQRQNAWTWERMAITRARVIAGPPILAARVKDALRDVVEQAGGNPAILKDAAAMRARLQRDLPPANIWDVKHRVGGLMEVEFIAQALQLVHAGSHPEVAYPATRLALTRLGEAGLLDQPDAELLIGADHLWRTVQALLRITVGRVADQELPQASAEALLRAVGRPGVDSMELLHQLLNRTAQQVRNCFERLIGPVVLEKKS